MNENINSIGKRYFVGQSVSIKRIVRKEDVEEFAALTGDFNGVHLDDEVARASIFGQRVCHGMLIASFISSVLGMYLPGEGTIYLSQEVQFRKPVYLDEEIEVIVEVEEIIEDKRIMVLKTTVKKAGGIIAIVGGARVMI